MGAQHPLGQHLATCTSPDNCEEYAHILTLSADQYARYLQAQRLRTAGARGELRAGKDPYAPIDGYGAALAKLRAASATPERTFAERYREARLAEFAAEQAGAPRASQRSRLTNLTEFEPPDSYSLALDKMRNGNR